MDQNSSYSSFSRFLASNVQSAPLCKNNRNEDSLDEISLKRKTFVSYRPSLKFSFDKSSQSYNGELLKSPFKHSDQSSKRFKINENSFTQLSDKSIEPEGSKHSPSRMNFSRISSSLKIPVNSRNVGFFSNLSYSPSAVNCSLKNETSIKNRTSFFYPGKTTYGGANLQKNCRSLPYCKINSKNIEAKPPKTSVSLSAKEIGLHLSSVTKRILENLEKASSSSPFCETQSKNFKKIDRLFDSSKLDVENGGKCKVDFKHMPLQFVITEKKENLIENDLYSVSIKNDIKKLNQIKLIEKEIKNKNTLDAINSDSKKYSGKITIRDVKKGKKIGDIENFNEEIMQSLANVKPVPAFSFSLKPFFSKSSEKTEKVENKKNEVFDFSMPKKVSHFEQIGSKKVASKKFDFSVPSKIVFSNAEKIQINEKNQLSTSSQLQVSQCENQQKESSNKNSRLIDPNKLTLAEQFKKKIVVWNCPTCSIDNDFDIEKCQACEERNPNSKSSNQKIININYSESSIKNQSQTNLQPSLSNKLAKNWTCSFYSSNDEKTDKFEDVNLNKKHTDLISSDLNVANDIFKNMIEKKSSKNFSEKNWTCSSCFVSNNMQENQCVSCQKIHFDDVSTASKITDSNVFKFGFSDDFAKKKIEKSQKAPNFFKPPISQDDKFFFGHFPKIPANSNSEIQKNDFSDNSKADKSWKCFYCKFVNLNSFSNSCNQCQKIKVIGATKEQVQKFYSNQTFKFGFNKPLEAASKLEDASTKTTDFKFGSPINLSLTQNFSNSDLVEKSNTLINEKNLRQKNNEKTVKAIKEKIEKEVNETTEKSTDLFSVNSCSTSFTDPNTQSVSAKANKTEETTFVPSSMNSTSNNTISFLSKLNSNSQVDSKQNLVSNLNINSQKPVASAEDSFSKFFVFGSTNSNKSTLNNATTINPITHSNTISTSTNNFQNSIFNSRSTFEQTKTTVSQTGSSIFSQVPITESMKLDTPAKSAVAGSASNIITPTNSEIGKINFGSSVTFPKINVGSSVSQTQNINLNFFPSSTSSSVNSFSSSVFSFGATNNPLRDFKSSEKLNEKFDFSNSASFNSDNSVFHSMPKNFNFSSNSNSLFTFNAKSTNDQQSSSIAPQSNLNLNPMNNNNLQNFASSNLFGDTNKLYSNQQQPSNQSLIPTFSSIPSSSINLQNSTFRFNSDSNFSSFSNGFKAQEPANSVFQFSASTANQSQLRPPNINDRRIKKARRRLNQ